MANVLGKKNGLKGRVLSHQGGFSSRVSPIQVNEIWQTGEWPTPWTQSLVITLPKKGNLQQCQNYPTISLIIHPSKSC